MQLKNAIITAPDEVKEGHEHDWDIDVAKEALHKLKDIVISVIKLLETIQKKNVLLQDPLQEIKDKEAIKDEYDLTLLEALRTKEEDNKKLKTEIVILTKDLNM